MIDELDVDVDGKPVEPEKRDTIGQKGKTYKFVVKPDFKPDDREHPLNAEKVLERLILGVAQALLGLIEVRDAIGLSDFPVTKSGFKVALDAAQGEVIKEPAFKMSFVSFKKEAKVLGYTQLEELKLLMPRVLELLKASEPYTWESKK